jgi:protein-tyrosine phosphatase
LTLVGNEDISDPIGLSPFAFCRAGDRIADAVVPLLLSLHSQLREPAPAPAPEQEAKILRFRRPEVPVRRAAEPPTVAFVAAAADSWKF